MNGWIADREASDSPCQNNKFAKPIDFTIVFAGQERFGNMTRVYYKEAAGAIIVFDITRAATFDGVTKWKNDLDSKVRLTDGRSIPAVLLGNKVR